MSDLITQKLNESFTVIDGPLDKLRLIFDYLKVERPGAKYEAEVQAGIKSPFDYFASVQNKKLLVMNGHVQLLKSFGVNIHEEEPEISEQEIDDFLDDIMKLLPFSPHDFQIKAFRESLLNYKQINKLCTSSGKSLTISLIAEFFRRKGKKGIILVPNINLLTQFKSDIKEYNLIDLYNDTHTIGGGSTERHFDNSLTISTWQSLLDNNIDLDILDYVIVDEAHRFASLETSSIVRKTLNCKYKFGFTGTLPESPPAKMQMIGLFGLPKTYITSRELIDRGLGTPIRINSLIMKYSKTDKNIFRAIEATGRSKNAFPNQLSFIKDHAERNKFVVNLTCRLRKTGNSLILFQHTLHGKQLFIDTMKQLYPDVEVENKNITGKKSFEFQQKYGVYFLNGEDNAETREKTRKILEEHDDATLVANFALLSTGTNIKKLHNLVLASPLKSYTAITQSIGRLMRLHASKKIAQVFDIIDDFGIRKVGGIFYKQYLHRKAVSYNSEEFPVYETDINMF